MPIIYSPYSLLTKSYCCENQKSKDEEYKIVPFNGIDSISINNWWKRKQNKIIDIKV